MNINRKWNLSKEYRIEPIVDRKLDELGSSEEDPVSLMSHQEIR